MNNAVRTTCNFFHHSTIRELRNEISLNNVNVLTEETRKDSAVINSETLGTVGTRRNI
jgi:hypothetical protein